MANSAKAEAIVYTFQQPVRSGFCNIIKAKAFTEAGKAKGDPRFDATFILEQDSPDLKALKDLCITMAKSMNPGKKLVTRRLTQEEFDDGGVVEVAMPWKDGTKAADKAKAAGKDQEFFRGMTTLKAASKYAPALSGIEGGKVIAYDNAETRPTLEKLFYSGAFMAPYVQLHSYPAKDDKPGGVSLWLNAVCFVKHGARLGGAGVNPAEVFKGYAGTASATDPTGGEMDDEIPF